MTNGFTNVDDNDLAAVAQLRAERRRLRSQRWRKFGSNVGTIAIIGAVAAAAGYGIRTLCKDGYADYEYRFNGVIDGEQVRAYLDH